MPSDSSTAVSSAGFSSSAAVSEVSSFLAGASVGRSSAQFTVLPSDFASAAAAFFAALLSVFSPAAGFSLSSGTALTSARKALSKDNEKRISVTKYPATWISPVRSMHLFALKLASLITKGSRCRNVSTATLAAASTPIRISGSFARMVLVTTIRNSQETTMMLPRIIQRSVENPFVPVMSFQSERIAPTAYSSAGTAIAESDFLATNQRNRTIRTNPPNIIPHPTKGSVSIALPSISAVGFRILGTKRACSIVTRKYSAKEAAVTSAKTDAMIGHTEPGETRSFFLIISKRPPLPISHSSQV